MSARDREYRRYGRQPRAHRGRTLVWLLLILVMVGAAALALADKAFKDEPAPVAATETAPAQKLLIREGLRREDVAAILDSGSVIDQIVVEPTLFTESSAQDSFQHHLIRDIDQDDRIGVVVFQEKLSLWLIPRETIQHEPVIPVVHFESFLDDFVDHIIGHQLPLRDDSLHSSAKLRVILNVPAKDIADAHVHQIERLA